MSDREFQDLKWVIDHLHSVEAPKIESKLQLLSQKDNIQTRTPEQELSYLFLKALNKHHSKTSSVNYNLYLEKDEVPQIKLFDILANHFPLIVISRKLANQLLASSISAKDEQVVLVSLGMGSGQQEAELLKLLAIEKKQPKKLIVFGVEPDQNTAELAGKMLEETAKTLGFNFEFKPLYKTFEALNLEDLKHIQQTGGKIIIHESFALHHTSYDALTGSEHRDALLKNLKALSPELMVLVEPNSDHLTANLSQRFENAWQHFGLVFQVIDQLLISTQEQRSLKRLFFGREIEDILCEDEKVRYERHESVEMWWQRLKNAKFESVCFDELAITQENNLVEIKKHNNHLALTVNDKTVVAIIGVK